jgi:hypothetical protein
MPACLHIDADILSFSVLAREQGQDAGEMQTTQE